MPIKRDNVNRTAIMIYIFILFTYGFWINFTGISIVIDIASLIVFACWIIGGSKRIAIDNTGVVYPLIFLFCVGVVLIAVVKSYSPRMSALGARDYFEFILIGIMAAHLLYEEEDYERILTFIERIGICICVFGLIQYVFNAVLPDNLLHVRSGVISYVYGLGALKYRINCLYENSIVCAGVIVFVFSVEFGRLLVYGKSAARLASLVIVVAACWLTYSRTAFIGLLLVACIEYLFVSKSNRGKRAVLIAIALLALLFVALNFMSDSYMIRRLLGEGDATVVSNTVHSSTRTVAIEKIKENWLLGVGMGTQGYDSSGSTIRYIRDGAWYTFALELGLPLTLVYALVLTLSIKKFIYDLKNNSSPFVTWITLACFSSTAYFFVAGFTGSAYNAKECFGLMWIITAMQYNANIVGGGYSHY